MQIQYFCVCENIFLGQKRFCFLHNCLQFPFDQELITNVISAEEMICVHIVPACESLVVNEGQKALTRKLNQSITYKNKPNTNLTSYTVVCYKGKQYIFFISGYLSYKLQNVYGLQVPIYQLTVVISVFSCAVFKLPVSLYKLEIFVQIPKLQNIL